MDEESAKPCIQDRLLAVAVRSKEIFASWPIICLTIIILIIITLPEILTLIIGRKVIIPILSEISLEGRLGILFSFSVALFSSLQYKINKSLLRIEEQRIQPFLYAEIDGKNIIIENSGGGIAWKCKLLVHNVMENEKFTGEIEKIYPRAKEIIDIEKKSTKLVRGKSEKMDRYEHWDLTIENNIKITIIYHIDEAGIKEIDWMKDFYLPGKPDKSPPLTIH